jgi:hypothetical protein
MSIWQDLLGTSSSIFGLSKTGPKIKNSSGVVEVRNNADDDYGNMKLDSLDAVEVKNTRAGDLNITSELGKINISGFDDVVITSGQTLVLKSTATNSLGNIKDKDDAIIANWDRDATSGDVNLTVIATNGTGHESSVATIYADKFQGQLDGSIGSATTATTQSTGDNSTKVATTAYTDNGLAAKQDTLTAANFGSFSNGLTAKTTPVNADSMNLVDSAASNVEKKVTWANIKATLKTYFDTLYQSNIQVVNTTTGAVATGTTVMPNDDTIPQNTEGVEFMTLAITPTSATNKLKIDVVFCWSTTTDATCGVALFQDSTANALAAVQDFPHTAYAVVKPTVFTYYMTAGTTSSTTFKIRAGQDIAHTLTFNGVGGARRLGGVMASSITITEIKV